MNRKKTPGIIFTASIVFSLATLWGHGRPADAEESQAAPVSTQTAVSQPAAVSTNTSPSEPQPAVSAPAPAPAPASSSEPRTTRAEYVGSETCLNCHANRKSFKKNIHALAWPKAKGIDFSHSCETCHGPGSLHAAAADKSDPNFFTIKNPKKLAGKAAAQLCLECHKGGARFNWEGGPHDSRDVSCLSCHSVHNDQVNAGKPPLLAKATVMETCFQCHNVRKAQFMRSSHMPVREGKMTCTDCHNPHGGTGPSQLKQASVNENCLSCHAEKKGPFLWEHPPVRENCLNCHVPHGSQHDKLLKAKKPRLCQECHIEASHPTTASNPSNLHLAARSCTECHSHIHGSNHPSGVRFQR